MKKELTPVFIFSLPRSGSTLLQKILMTNPKINSVAEPWILLPFLKIIESNGGLTTYNQQICYRALKDFISNAGGEKIYLKNLKKFILKMYNSVSDNGHLFFLDKTPRYYMIIPQIAKVFPKAKFIFLFRNPLAIYSSILKTWHDNKFLTLHNNYVDLFKGPNYLIKGYKILKEKSIKVNYEDLITNKHDQLLRIANYLELSLDNFNLEKFKTQDLKGRMGDREGIKNYSKISKKSLNKWKKTFSNLYRKKIAKDYVNSLDDYYLELANINENDIIKEINSIEVSGLGLSDFFGLLISNIYRKMKVKFQVQNGWEILSKSEEKTPYF